MSTAILSRLVTFSLIVLVAGYVVMANTTPSTSAASMVSEKYRTDIVQTSQTPAQRALAREQERYDAMSSEELDEILKPVTLEVSRPRSPFLERMPQVFEPEPVVAKPAQKATARENTSTKNVRTKGRRVRTTNPFVGMFQSKYRSFNSDTSIRDANQSIFGPRTTSKRAIGSTY